MLKIIANALVFLLITVHAYAGGAMGLMMGTTGSAAAPTGETCAAGCPGTSTYVGTTTAENEWGNTGAWWFRYDGVTHSPASNGRLCDIAVYAKSGGGTPGNIRVALYNSSDQLVAEVNSEKAVTSTSYSWISWTCSEIVPVGGVAGDACELLSATAYKIAFAVDATDVKVNYQGGGGAGSGTWGSADYTGGFPSTLADSSGTVALVLLKMGTQ